MRDLTGSL